MQKFTLTPTPQKINMYGFSCNTNLSTSTSISSVVASLFVNWSQSKVASSCIHCLCLHGTASKCIFNRNHVKFCYFGTYKVVSSFVHKSVESLYPDVNHTCNSLSYVCQRQYFNMLGPKCFANC